MEVTIDEKGALGLLALGDFGLDIWKALKEKKPIPKPNEIKKRPEGSKNRTLIIGWDSADWKTINPMLEQGIMPTLKKFLDGASKGKIRTMDPSFSPMLWTSIATGKYADKHGILGFVEPNSTGQGAQPVQSTSRKCHALWNILGSQGLKSNVIGWWPSHPVEPINGAMVTNQFHKINHKRRPKDKKGNVIGKGKKLVAKNAVHPPEIESELVKYRVHTTDLTSQHILPFVPKAREVDQEKDTRISRLADDLAQLATVHASTTWLMQNQDWDLTAVYFNELDHISHVFGRYTAPKAPHIKDEDFEMYKDVVQGAYRFYDMMLARLVELAGDDTNIIILSDHGFKLGEEKVLGLPKMPAAIALEHNPYGILCMKGPDISKNKEISGAGLLDITPTVLHLLDLPVGEDMDGKVLSQVLNKNNEPKYIDSWENQEGEFGGHPEVEQTNPLDAKDTLEQLIALGYIEELDGDTEEQMNRIVRDMKYNLSKVHADQQRIEESLHILEELYKEDMVDMRFNVDLIHTYSGMQRFEEAKKVLSNFRKFDISKSVNFDQLEISIALQEGNHEHAETLLLERYNANPQNNQIVLDLGLLYAKMGKSKKAEKYLKRLATKDCHNPVVWHNMGKSCFKQKKYSDAMDYLVKALEFRPNYPAAHYYIGECLLAMEHYEEAANAFETCLQLNPGLNRARNQLMNLYKFHMSNDIKLKEHKTIFEEAKKNEIIVVTGLPRSGTSMVMQMLNAGGIEIFSDGQRKADDSNPKGYFESEEVKGTIKDSSWMSKSTGKAVKIVAPLVNHALDLKYQFKVIWIERKMSEVMMSQEEMLQREDPHRKKVLNLGIQKEYQKILNRMQTLLVEKNNVKFIKLNYKEILENSMTAAETLSDFLGQRGDVQRMAEVVDNNLYRTKTDSEITLS